MGLVKKITKIGNSYGLILPSDVMELVGIKPESEVEISVEKEGLFIHPTLKEDRLVIENFATFVKRYGDTLKKLAQ